MHARITTHNHACRHAQPPTHLCQALCVLPGQGIHDAALPAREVSADPGGDVRHQLLAPRRLLLHLPRGRQEDGGQRVAPWVCVGGRHWAQQVGAVGDGLGTWCRPGQWPQLPTSLPLHTPPGTQQPSQPTHLVKQVWAVDGAAEELAAIDFEDAAQVVTHLQAATTGQERRPEDAWRSGDMPVAGQPAGRQAGRQQQEREAPARLRAAAAPAPSVWRWR